MHISTCWFFIFASKSAHILIIAILHKFNRIRAHPHNHANQINNKFITELQRYNVNKIMPFKQYAFQYRMHMKMFDKYKMLGCYCCCVRFLFQTDKMCIFSEFCIHLFGFKCSFHCNKAPFFISCCKASEDVTDFNCTSKIAFSLIAKNFPSTN